MKLLRKTLIFSWSSFFERKIREAFLLCIVFYKCHLSGFFGGACRYTPSCSLYAEEALRKLPLGKACWVILKRLLCCHPFQTNYGYDPVDK